MTKNRVLGRAMVLALVVMACVAAQADDKTGAGGNGNNPYAIGLWGDMPYSRLQATVGVPNLIADMNSQNLSFTVHDGDLKAGSGSCADSLYTQALGYLNSLKAPAMFTPGDNDWTDCDRNAGVNSLERLDHERTVFFSTSYSLGQTQIQQEVQSTPLCKGYGGSSGVYTDVPCVENRRWKVGRVTYATLNVQGSCNNLCDVFPDSIEWAARNAADIEWMQETLQNAAADGSVAVMFISQADPAFDNTDLKADNQRDPNTLAQIDGKPDGFQAFLVALRDAVVAFGKPVAYVHGDSHYFRVDHPLHRADGHRIQNFTRVETFGDNQANGNNDVNWLKVYVDPNSREVFSYQPQIVQPNQP